MPKNVTNFGVPLLRHPLPVIYRNLDGSEYDMYADSEGTGFVFENFAQTQLSGLISSDESVRLRPLRGQKPNIERYVLPVEVSFRIIASKATNDIWFGTPQPVRFGSPTFAVLKVRVPFVTVR